MMFSRIFHTIFTPIMQICPLSNMAELTLKSPIIINDVFKDYFIFVALTPINYN